MKKQIIAAFAALALAVTLTACGDKAKEAADQAAAAAKVAAEKAAEATKAAAKDAAAKTEQAAKDAAAATTDAAGKAADATKDAAGQGSRCRQGRREEVTRRRFAALTAGAREWYSRAGLKLL